MLGSLSMLLRCSAAHCFEPPERKGSQARQDRSDKSSALEVVPHVGQPPCRLPGEESGGLGSRGRRRLGGGSTCRLLGRGRRRLGGGSTCRLLGRGRRQLGSRSRCRLLGRVRCRPGSRGRCRLLGRGCRLGGRDGGVHQDRVDGGRDAIDHVACGTINIEM